MADTEVKFTLNGDTAVGPDVLKGTLGQDIIDIRTLDSKGVFTFDPGFTSTASCESKITFIDGDEGILPHRSFPIDQLVTDSNYLEVCYVLLSSEEPTQEQYDEFKITATRHTTIHEQITRLFHAFRRDSHPMAVMCGIIGALAVFYRDSLNVNNPRHREIVAFRPLSRMLTMATMYYKYSIGRPSVYPRNDPSHADNFLSMMFSTPYEPHEANPILECAIDRVLIPHADHEQDTSTSAVRTTGSLGANPFACVAAGITSLWELAHGGADETAPKVLEGINSVKHILESARRAKDKNNSFRLMGFGHRIHKNYDLHVTAICETCHEVLKELSTKDDLLEVAMEPESIALNDPYSVEKKLHPNVDFYSGIILKAVGIPSSTFTVIFVIVRTVGWIAHWSEIHSDGMKIVRPCQLCIGYEKRDFKSDIKH